MCIYVFECAIHRNVYIKEIYRVMLEAEIEGSVVVNQSKKEANVL